MISFSIGLVNNRIRHLDLKLTLPPALREQSWVIAQQLREGFLSEVVESIAEHLQAKYGEDAIIEIPLLEIQWDGQEVMLTNYDQAKKIGVDIANQLINDFDERCINQVPDIHQDNLKIQVYRDQVHKLVMSITACARKQQIAADMDTLNAFEHNWQELCQQGSRCITTGLKYLCDTGETESVVESLSLSMIQMALSVYPLSQWPSPVKDQVIERLLSIMPANMSGSNYTLSSETVNVIDKNESNTTNNNKESDESSLVHNKFQEHSVDTNGKKTQLAEKIKETDEGVKRKRHLSDITDDRNSYKDDVTENRIPDILTGVEEDKQQRLSDENSKQSLKKQEDPVSTSVINSLGADHDYISTQYAGLVYMLNLIMKIELPEILWCCGIDEKSFLFDIFKRLIDTSVDSDPLIHILSGVNQDCSNYRGVDVSDWAISEIIHKVHNNLTALVTNHETISLNGTDIENHIDQIITKQNSWLSLVDEVKRLLESAFLDIVRASDLMSIQHFLRQQGMIERIEDSVRIVMQVEQIDIDVRRAALDVNPSQLQWVKISLCLDFRTD